MALVDHNCSFLSDGGDRDGDGRVHSSMLKD